MYDRKTVLEVRRIVQLKIDRLERLLLEAVNLSESDRDLIHAKLRGLIELRADFNALEFT